MANLWRKSRLVRKVSYLSFSKLQHLRQICTFRTGQVLLVAEPTLELEHLVVRESRSRTFLPRHVAVCNGRVTAA